MLGCNVWLQIATLNSEAVYLFYCAMRLKTVGCTGMQVQSYTKVSAPGLCDHYILYTQCLIRNALSGSADVDWGFPVPEILYKTSLTFQTVFFPFSRAYVTNFQLLKSEQ